ncbi:MAG: 23S rRNA pseudouridine(1911/1915/1917) synthase RluD [Gammaproteobacteria bacterium]|nr:23S rRNA pseudouridine(1911/1915/1917) synthase RluD [Gammaproteobacteria bacterium]
MSDVSRQSTVPPELAGERVDKAAAVLFDEFSRAALTGWIQAGALTVDGSQVKPRIKVLGGELLVLKARIEPREDWQAAESVPFDVVYEDDDLLVINKPAGVVVHPGAGNPSGTLVNGLLAHRRALELMPRAGIVHRLDKDTSGLLLVAADLTAHKRLVDALQARKITRAYLALVEGVMVGGRDIDRPIGRDPVRRTLQRVRDDGRPALTRVRVADRYRSHTLIRAELETGRTHQIRVHMSSIGHPLVGDSRYGARGRIPPGADTRLIDVIRGFDRQALHAERLAFDHPRSGEAVSFQAPIPADMAALILALKADTNG